MSLCTHCSLCLFILILQVSAPLVTLVPSLYSLHSTMTFILFLCLLSVSTTTIPRTETLWVWYAQCPAQGTQHIAHAQEPLMSNCSCHGLYSRGPPSILCALNSSSPSKTQMSPPGSGGSETRSTFYTAPHWWNGPVSPCSFTWSTPRAHASPLPFPFSFVPGTQQVIPTV